MIFKQKKSITVQSSGVGEDIYIFNDELFNGEENNCPDCRYYPCIVNRWYGKSKKIQDCDMWNKFEPSGKIVDRR